jgi:hypothetical protein
MQALLRNRKPGTSPLAPEAVAAWLEKQPFDLGLMVVMEHPQKVPLVTLENFARRGLAHEAPSIRRNAMGLLHHLRADTARDLAAEALTDEPDPALRRQLEEHASPVANGQ